MWSFYENKIGKKKHGKEKSMLTKDVEILVLRNGEKKKTHENDSPTITKVNIQEFKTRATMY
jgi:hypothetical protein